MPLYNGFTINCSMARNSPKLRLYYIAQRNDWMFFFATFVASVLSFGFFIRTKSANDLRLPRISIPDFIHYSFNS